MFLWWSIARLDIVQYSILRFWAHQGSPMKESVCSLSLKQFFQVVHVWKRGTSADNQRGNQGSKRSTKIRPLRAERVWKVWYLSKPLPLAPTVFSRTDSCNIGVHTNSEQMRSKKEPSWESRQALVSQGKLVCQIKTPLQKDSQLIIFTNLWSL